MKSPIQRQMELFSAALEHPAGPERDAFLAKECAGDDALLECVRTLLAGHSQAGSFLAQPAGPVGPTGTHLLPSTEKPGDKIGRYKLLQQIGEGGCGTVYMAEQEEPVRRRVALKVIRLGMDTKSVIARFEAERQALALMDHPNIAKVFDGGATENGRPYFVMELVRGIKITDYCDQAQLSTTERLQLFIQVCQAVQHAHQKGIIHRDIKPSNILVTVNDGVAVPKVIDFGIAKATDQRLTDKTYFTQFQAFIGTPAYTSPEQAEMSSLDIDTRSDIYSLGVLLYELLTGQTPFPAERLLQSGLDEMRRIIREEEPPRPSTRLTTLGLADATELSRKRQAKIPQLASAVEGDLDWIVMKALEKDRSRRYATSLDFAADLQRHLTNEAVLARPPSLVYKFQRAYRRNRIAFTAAGSVVVSLIISMWFIWVAGHREGLARVRESAERNRAEQQRDRALAAESNATVKATEATNALQTANERMVKLNVAEGWRRVEEGDHFGALLPFAEAFALEEYKPDRAEIHQMRLASVLQHCPKLVNVWSVGTNINHAEFSKDGANLLISTTSDEAFNSETQTWAQVFAASTGRALTIPMQHRHRITSVLWSDDETRIVSASHDETVKVWDAATGHLIGKPFVHGGPVIRARFSGDGAKVLTLGVISTRFDGDDQDWFYGAGLHLWDVRTSGLVWSNCIPDPAPKGNPVLLSPEGQIAVSAYDLFDARTGKLLSGSYRESHRLPPPPYLGGGNAILSGHTGGDCDPMAHASEFSPDGRRLFIGGTLRDGRIVERIIKRWPAQEEPHWVRFSHDGSKLATANEGATTRIWNAEDGSPVASPMEHRDAVSDVTFSFDGAWFATGTVAGDARIWDAATGKPVTPWLPHNDHVLRVAFSASGNQLRVACRNGLVSIWNLETLNVPRFTWFIPHFNDNHSQDCQLASDGSYLLTRTETNSAVTAWSLIDGSPMLPSITISGYVTPTTNHLVVRDGSAWSLIHLKDSAAVVHPGSTYVKYPWAYKSAGQSQSGRWLITRTDPELELVVLDALNGQQIANLGSTHQVVGHPLIRPDGQQIVAGLKGGQLIHWNPSSPQEANVLQADYWYPKEYSPGGRWLRMTHHGPDNWSYGGEKLFDSRTFKDLFKELYREDDEDGYSDLGEISPDDRWALMEKGQSCRILCLTTNGSIKSPVLRHRGETLASAFTADSKLVITAGSDRTLQFWSVPNGERILLPTTVTTMVSSDGILVSANGRGFVTVHVDDTMRFWELPKGQRPVADWLALARLFAKGRGEAVGGAGTSSMSLTPQSFRDEWLALRVKHPEVFTVSADEIDAWHRHEAWRAESTRNWSNAITHLSALLATHPDSGDFLPRRAAAYVAMASNLVASGVSRITSQADAPQQENQIRLTPDATNLLERALADYNRTLAWVDRFPAIAKESRLPFVEKRREVYLKLGRKAEANADERELKALGK